MCAKELQPAIAHYFDDSEFDCYNSVYSCWSEAYRARGPLANEPTLRQLDPVDPEHLTSSTSKKVIAKTWNKTWNQQHQQVDSKEERQKKIRFRLILKDIMTGKGSSPKPNTKPSKSSLRPPKYKTQNGGQPKISTTESVPLLEVFFACWYFNVFNDSSSFEVIRLLVRMCSATSLYLVAISLNLALSLSSFCWLIVAPA